MEKLVGHLLCILLWIRVLDCKKMGKKFTSKKRWRKSFFFFLHNDFHSFIKNEAIVKGKGNQEKR